MHHSSLFLTAALIGTTVALVQPAAVAKSAAEIQSIARAVTVEIKLKQSERVGSGVIINKKDDLYTLVTNRHVICGTSNCQRIAESEVYSLGLFDGQKYQVKKSAIKLLDGDLDLAIIQFRSSRNYVVAKVATSGSLKVEDNVYTAGFPLEQQGFEFGEGKAIAVINKRLTGDNGGYTIVYDAFTLPGMSGGGVFNGNGQLVAIHGYGDRFKENTDLDTKSRVDSKIGVNRGIPISWLVQNLGGIGINLGANRSTSSVRDAHSQVPTTADEHFIAGFNKLVEPGKNVVAGKKQAIQEFDKAIQLNPKYQYAYFLRAYTRRQVKDFQQSLADYNQAISISPKYSIVYYNRANLKADKLNDIRGALADYDQAISINPEYSTAYNNRALLKADKLNDIRGALADYDQAISINPEYSAAYNNRALLKADKMNDIRGALVDYDQSISISPKYSIVYYNRANLKADKLNDLQGALADFNQSISINPKYSTAYSNRAILKAVKLNDLQGALIDFNQAISINPRDSEAYYNRALLKHEKLNDIQGALTDYNQAISINPDDSKTYYNRGALKINNLNDRPGAIQDLRQAARLYRDQKNNQGLQNSLNALRKLGATE
jgi:tetratricopeptide (TPR) repeat protein/V8-like Glu-specific endopeptidase